MSNMDLETVDVVIVGSGNAGLSAAASAKEHGARGVVVLEKAPESWAGGNSTFTAGAYRTVFSGLHDVLPLVNNVPHDMIDKIDMEPYTKNDFLRDLNRMCNNRSDPELAKTLVEESNETTKWLHKNGIRFQLSFNRQAYEINGRQKFWGGMVLKVEDGGKGLIKQHLENCRRLGVDVRYDSSVVELSLDERGSVKGVSIKRTDGTTYTLLSRSIILCAGGFEANPQMRVQHLGPNWELAYVRGTPYNTGDMLRLAIDEVGAMPTGDWSGCHSTCWDFNAPMNAGDQRLTNQFTKSGYPLGLMFNIKGLRFVDEGEDMRNYTYAKFGKAILQQPDGIAFQVWDAEGAAWLRKEEYGEDVVERLTAESLEDLAKKLREKGMRDERAFLRSIQEYNEAVTTFQKENPDKSWNPSEKDGLSTVTSNGGLALGPNKTNWATPIIKPPFLAVKITCGITFTFGGLKADAHTGAVIRLVDKQPIEGLFVAGEMLGGIFYDNYPGGSGLTAGAVFGRRAGREAAKLAKAKQITVC
ncbi:precorrin 3B synthase CobZ [Verruconis gallopava]|uniref:Precorrin 3B synthase CobZ n=1 Tax=Verruconis gallopava TaxID=253628 RepID=A0A0D1XIP1_9PEZI|nr:precorrin 3B synthase CobZ [Verruconis gallopava]KIW02201.1 precorrin 3B synthase CobZ [Verruconis gallopava]